MQFFERERLRKVQPFLIPSGLAAALDAVIESMRSPMFPRVTIAFAARELLVLGCDVLDAAIQSKRPITWTVVDPPRGPRRSEERATARDQRVVDETYTQVSPLALPEALIERLHALHRRLMTATKTKLSITKVMREALSLGCAERERVRRDSDAFIRANAALLALAGFPDASRIRVVASGIAAQPKPPKAARASAARAKSRPAKPTKPVVEPPVADRPRARTARRRAVPRRATTGDEGGDDDGGDEPDGAPCDRFARRAS